MTTAIVIANRDALAIAGQQANQYAAATVFKDYRDRIAPNTRLRQDADLRLFAAYLQDADLPGCNATDLAEDAECWRGMTWGLVSGFVQWMLQQGYAVGSVNVRLATIKRYCELSTKAGVIDKTEHMLIKAVQGYGYSQGVNIDKQRETTRRTRSRTDRAVTKKAEAIVLSTRQVKALLRLPDFKTAQGRRDALLLGLLLEHGLRCGEIAALTVGAVDLESKTLAFYRAKVKKSQTLNLTPYTEKAAIAYFKADAPAVGKLLLGSRKGGKLVGGMSERAINDRVRTLGKRIGLVGLSPHDCRHTWATWHARDAADPFRLQEMGGWNSLAMPRRYIEAAKRANEGANPNVYGLEDED